MSRDFVPNGQITLNSKVLIDLFDFDLDGDNGLQLKATLARRGGIPVLGMQKVTLTGSILITNEQPQTQPLVNMLNGQRDEMGIIVNADATGAAAAFGGLACTASVTWGPCKLSVKLGEGCIYACTWMGTIIDTNM